MKCFEIYRPSYNKVILRHFASYMGLCGNNENFEIKWADILEMKCFEIYQIGLCQFVILNIKFSLEITGNTNYFTEVKWCMLIVFKNNASTLYKTSYLLKVLELVFTKSPEVSEIFKNEILPSLFSLHFWNFPCKRLPRPISLLQTLKTQRQIPDFLVFGVCLW